MLSVVLAGNSTIVNLCQTMLNFDKYRLIAPFLLLLLDKVADLIYKIHFLNVCKRSKKEKLHYYVTPSQTKQPHVILINPAGMCLAPLLTFNINKFMRPCIKSSDLQQSYDRASRMIADNLLGLQKTLFQLGKPFCKHQVVLNCYCCMCIIRNTFRIFVFYLYT